MDSRKKVKLVKRRKQTCRSNVHEQMVDQGDSIVALLINEFGGHEVDEDGNYVPPKGVV